ncbi:FMN-binding split barrel [Venustampulla echinocandica]|uniref:FMN-binding split barrel n=1 Tax=Venustampulla echinocandica TaxID=2656787 RepID=A0A370TNB6_9HELO|nr:FMN-binding split barrel [Venustampulla echinocandica]RDL37015.1 FMN-binding split barrel [Venustampulla echinocandica]
MQALALLSVLLPLASSISIPAAPQNILSNPSLSTIPTSYESAILARRILHLTPLGTLSTVFPSSSSSSHDAHSVGHQPEGVDGMPIGLMDYISECEDTGDPTIISMGIATSFRNVAAGSNISLSVQWTPPSPPHSAAALPRFSLLGYLEKIDLDEEQGKEEQLKKCYTEHHPDAKWWLPPGKYVHRSEWVRLVVQHVYWVGGFGDRAYIGWIPMDEWRSVTREQWEEVRLPGEEGKKGWMGWLRDLEFSPTTGS